VKLKSHFTNLSQMDLAISTSRIRLQKLTVAQLAKKFLALNRTQIFFKTPPLVPTLGQMNSTHILPPYLPKIHSNGGWFFLTEHHTMKAYRESGCTAPHILVLGTRWRWMVSFTPRPLYPRRKSPWYPSDRRIGGAQNRSGRGGEEKNSQPLPGLEPPIVQPVAQRCTTELSH
jgi:hypothetical protein